jgi:hypothetical protein
MVMNVNLSLYFQMLMAEKDHGLQKLNATIEAGEKLYPDTAAGGREKVRQELRTSKDDLCNWIHLSPQKLCSCS